MQKWARSVIEMFRPAQGAETRTAGWDVTFAESDFAALQAHLFPGDGDEHGAVLLAGVADRDEPPRLLVREVILAEDGVDYVPGQRGYRALTPTFIARCAQRARDEGFAYLAVHCHGGTDRVAFSQTDIASHERGYPALVDLTSNPVGALVFAANAVAGELFVANGDRRSLTRARVVGRNVRHLYPNPPSAEPLDATARVMYDRQARMFGDRGQAILGSMRVGVIGAGGAGMLAVHMLARLGVGELVIVDPDDITPSNLPRLPGALRADAYPPRWRGRHRTLKVSRAAKIVREANSACSVATFPTSVDDEGAVQSLARCDALVLAADTHLARHVANAISHAYLLPMFQVGVKVPVERATGDVGDVFAVARRVNPDSGCLWCNGLINATALQLEALGEEGVRAMAYVDDPAVGAPSVISLNGIAVSHAVTDLVFAFTGLYPLALDPRDREGVPYLRVMVKGPTMHADAPRKDAACFHCATTDGSLLARGDRAVLPTRLSGPSPGRAA